MQTLHYGRFEGIKVLTTASRKVQNDNITSWEWLRRMRAKQSLSYKGGMTSSQTCDLASVGSSVICSDIDLSQDLEYPSISTWWHSLAFPQQIYSCLYWRFGVHITRKQMNQNLTIYLVLCKSFIQPHCVAKEPGTYATAFGFHPSGLPSLLLSASPSWHYLPHSGQGNISVPCSLGIYWLA